MDQRPRGQLFFKKLKSVKIILSQSQKIINKNKNKLITSSKLYTWLEQKVTKGSKETC
jgi:hypothetical protein